MKSYTKKQLSFAINDLEDGKLYQIKEVKDNRSTQQNNYYWKVVIGTLTDAMNKKLENSVTTDDVHEYCKITFNYSFIGKVKVGKSTTKLDTKEFIAYYEKIQRFGAEHCDCYIPDPNEEEYLSWIDNQ